MSDSSLNQTAIAIGDDLYGVSVVELEERLSRLKAEITRTKAELDKKQRERADADKLFGRRS